VTVKLGVVEFVSPLDSPSASQCAVAGRAGWGACMHVGGSGRTCGMGYMHVGGSGRTCGVGGGGVYAVGKLITGVQCTACCVAWWMLVFLFD